MAALVPTVMNSLAGKIAVGTVATAAGGAAAKKVLTPKIPAAIVKEEKEAIAIPNPSTAKKDARKQLARRSSSGRSSTILTEKLGG